MPRVRAAPRLHPAPWSLSLGTPLSAPRPAGPEPCGQAAGSQHQLEPGALHTPGICCEALGAAWTCMATHGAQGGARSSPGGSYTCLARGAVVAGRVPAFQGPGAAGGQSRGQSLPSHCPHLCVCTACPTPSGVGSLQLRNYLSLHFNPNLHFLRAMETVPGLALYTTHHTSHTYIHTSHHTCTSHLILHITPHTHTQNTHHTHTSHLIHTLYITHMHTYITPHMYLRPHASYHTHIPHTSHIHHTQHLTCTLSDTYTYHTTHHIPHTSHTTHNTLHITPHMYLTPHTPYHRTHTTHTPQHLT